MNRVSIVICTYNRDKYLPTALESIKHQTAPRDQFELVVVDNRSTDNTAAITKQFIADNPGLNVRYCFEENKGLSFARNRGIKEAQYEIISYTDDDAFLVPEYVQEMIAFFNTHSDAVGVGGRVVPKYENDKEPIWMNKYLNGFVGRVDFGESPIIFTSAMKYPAGCNMTYKKETLMAAGGFNNSLTFRSDDKYIFYKVKEVSPNIYYNPHTWVYHVIDDARLKKDNFRKLFLKTGNEEKKRLKSENGNLFTKFISYLIKVSAAIALWILFALKGQSAKGHYVFLSQWYTLKGFLAKDVFVR